MGLRDFILHLGNLGLLAVGTPMPQSPTSELSGQDMSQSLTGHSNDAQQYIC